MGVAKNATKDFVGEVEQNIGHLAHQDEMEEEGFEKRVEAQEKELEEEQAQGRDPHDSQVGADNNGLPAGDFNKPSRALDEVSSEGSGDEPLNQKHDETKKPAPKDAAPAPDDTPGSWRAPA